MSRRLWAPPASVAAMCGALLIAPACNQLFDIHEQHVAETGNEADAPELRACASGPVTASCGGASVDLCSDGAHCGACFATCKDDLGILECREGRCLDHAFAAWTAPKGAVCSAVSGTDRVKQDLHTGLLWERTPPTTKFKDLAVANAHCKSLDDETRAGSTDWGGLTGWRLPTRIEAASIPNYFDLKPMRNNCFNEPTTEQFYCTLSESGATDAKRHFLLRSTDGWLAPQRVDLVGCVARCVRPTRGEPRQRFSAVSDGVYDRVTKLTWQDFVPTNPYNEAAVSKDFIRGEAGYYCNSRGKPWRVPTPSELATLVDDRAYGPAITAFAEPDGYFLWSAYLYPETTTAGASRSWVLDQNDGRLVWHPGKDPAPGPQTAHLRCVHGNEPTTGDAGTD